MNKKKIHAYVRNDYAGLETENYNFYFGYGHTKCTKYENIEKCPLKPSEDQCSECFVEKELVFCVNQNDKIIFEVKESDLKEVCQEESPSIEQYLLVGIGIFIEKFIKKGEK